MTAIEIDSKVSFNLDDAIARRVGTVIGLEEGGNGTVYSPKYVIYVIRDDRSGWVHRLTDRDKVHAIEAKKAEPSVTAWDGHTF